VPDFQEAYERHVWDVYGFLAYRTGVRGDAEDLTQQTFEKALRAWGRYDPSRAGLRTWLLAIAGNVLIDHYRADRSALHEPLEGQAEQHPAPPVEPDLGLEPEVAAALPQLSDREREIIALRYGGDLSGPEIAALTGLSLSNVQQILSRSLRRLRGLIEAELPTR
jgi:RNA polymerase sigma-70 factor (ECF subfamily)